MRPLIGEMHPVYGDKYFTRPAIHVWCKKFAHARESVVDEEEPGRRVVSTTDAIRSGRLPHAVKPASDRLNIYMNLDDKLKNETLMFDV